MLAELIDCELWFILCVFEWSLEFGVLVGLAGQNHGEVQELLIVVGLFFIKIKVQIRKLRCFEGLVLLLSNFFSFSKKIV